MTTRLQQLAQWRLPYARSLGWTMEGELGRLHTWVSRDGRIVRRFAQPALLPRGCPEKHAGRRCLDKLGHGHVHEAGDMLWHPAHGPSCPADRGRPERCPDGCWCSCHRA
jgi:hypothetical protein